LVTFLHTSKGRQDNDVDSAKHDMVVLEARPSRTSS